MLPFTTTLVTLEPLTAGTVPYEGNTYGAAVRDVPGVVSNLSAAARYVDGSGQLVSAMLHVDRATVLDTGMRCTDQMTDAVYLLADWDERYEFGIDYKRAGLVRAEGRAAA